VIEKCLESNQKKELTELLLRGTNYQDDINLVMHLGVDMLKNLSLRLKVIVDKLIYHQFGNYVLQKMITVMEDSELKWIILGRIKEIQSDLYKTKHGAKVYNKLAKTYPSVFDSTKTSGFKKSSPAFYRSSGGAKVGGCGTTQQTNPHGK
jgi:hypothetical protein